MNRIKSLLLLLVLCLSTLALMAEDDMHIIKLQSEMLRLIKTNDKGGFYYVTEQLKAECQKRGYERMFYTTWGNQATYESAHLEFSKAETIANDIADYAENQQSHWGKYIVLHTKAINSLYRQDFNTAEKEFKKAVEFRHKYFAGESAADDLQELMKIADHNKDYQASLEYAYRILDEPNVSPLHRGGALYRLSQFAFSMNKKVLFDSVYNELQALKNTEGLEAIEPIVEVNNLVMAGKYDEALQECENLSPENRAERMAIIYHRMGNNMKAYEYMSKFKEIHDSIMLVSQGNLVATFFMQMSNDRLNLEQKILKEENANLRLIIYYSIIIIIVIILAIIIWQNRRRIKFLEKEKEKLTSAFKNAEKAFDMKNEFISQITSQLREPLNPIEGFTEILGAKEYELQPDEREELSHHIKKSANHITKLIDELAELSFYESKKSLPIDYKLSPNHILRHMVDSMRSRCKPGVRMFFETDLPDNFVIEQNEKALEVLMKHLLNNATQFTDKGAITVSCSEYNDKLHINVTDMGCGISPELREHIFDTFVEIGESPKLNGLGLPICKAITKLCGGDIWIDTSYTEGARFIVEMPKNATLRERAQSVDE